MPKSLMESVITEIPGVQPWPEDAQLFTPYEVEQITLSEQASCLAVRAYLKICNLPFSVEMRSNAEWMSPSGKVPFLKCGNFLVAELEFIVQHIEKRGISIRDKPMDPEEIADMRAYISMIDGVLHNAELYVCWVDENTYNNVTSTRNSSVFPWPLSSYQNWSKRSKVIKQLKMFSWYEKSLEDVLAEVEKCCSALCERLGNKEYFFGSQPTELDALVFGHVFAIVTTPLPGDLLAGVVNKFDPLLKLTNRIENKYFKQKS